MKEAGRVQGKSLNAQVLLSVTPERHAGDVNRHWSSLAWLATAERERDEALSLSIAAVAAIPITTISVSPTDIGASDHVAPTISGVGADTAAWPAYQRDGFYV